MIDSVDSQAARKSPDRRTPSPQLPAAVLGLFLLIVSVWGMERLSSKRLFSVAAFNVGLTTFFSLGVFGVACFFLWVSCRKQPIENQHLLSGDDQDCPAIVREEPSPQIPAPILEIPAAILGVILAIISIILGCRPNDGTVFSVGSVHIGQLRLIAIGILNYAVFFLWIGGCRHSLVCRRWFKDCCFNGLIAMGTVTILLELSWRWGWWGWWGYRTRVPQVDGILILVGFFLTVWSTLAFRLVRAVWRLVSRWRRIGAAPPRSF